MKVVLAIATEGNSFATKATSRQINQGQK